MRWNMDDVHFLTGSPMILEQMPEQSPRGIFAPEVLDFFAALSQKLLADPTTKIYPDLLTFAFWCRRASLTEQARPYLGRGVRIGWGMTLHIAPGNVPLNFAYSLAAGLLAGNANAVRLPSTPSPQTERLCTAMQELLDQTFPMLRPSIVCLRYPREHPLTAALSVVCDTRVIWGGDETVRRIRALPMKPRAREICFADRFSVCVINSDAYLAASDQASLARGFYNDTYLTGQAACTAPRIVLWIGTESAAARKQFWEKLQVIAVREYALSAAESVNKREAACLLAALYPDIKLSSKDNFLVRIETKTLAAGMPERCPGGGFFIETTADTLDALLPVCTEKCQTAALYGIDPEVFADFLCRNHPRGIDRIVSIGHTMDFSLIWDGIDLMETLSRQVAGMEFLNQ